MEYTFKRMITGMASPNDEARPLMATLLTSLLNNIDKIYIDMIDPFVDSELDLNKCSSPSVNF